MYFTPDCTLQLARIIQPPNINQVIKETEAAIANKDKKLLRLLAQSKKELSQNLLDILCRFTNSHKKVCIYPADDTWTQKRRSLVQPFLILGIIDEGLSLGFRDSNQNIFLFMPKSYRYLSIHPYQSINTNEKVKIKGQLIIDYALDTEDLEITCTTHFQTIVRPKLLNALNNILWLNKQLIVSKIEMDRNLTVLLQEGHFVSEKELMKISLPLYKKDIRILCAAVGLNYEEQGAIIEILDTCKYLKTPVPPELQSMVTLNERDLTFSQMVFVLRPNTYIWEIDTRAILNNKRNPTLPLIISHSEENEENLTDLKRSLNRYWHYYDTNIPLSQQHAIVELRNLNNQLEARLKSFQGKI